MPPPPMRSIRRKGPQAFGETRLRVRGSFQQPCLLEAFQASAHLVRMFRVERQELLHRGGTLGLQEVEAAGHELDRLLAGRGRSLRRGRSLQWRPRGRILADADARRSSRRSGVEAPTGARAGGGAARRMRATRRTTVEGKGYAEDPTIPTMPRPIKNGASGPRAGPAAPPKKTSGIASVPGTRLKHRTPGVGAGIRPRSSARP